MTWEGLSLRQGLGIHIDIAYLIKPDQTRQTRHRQTDRQTDRQTRQTDQTDRAKQSRAEQSGAEQSRADRQTDK